MKSTPKRSRKAAPTPPRAPTRTRTRDPESHSDLLVAPRADGEAPLVSGRPEEVAILQDHLARKLRTGDFSEEARTLAALWLRRADQYGMTPTLREALADYMQGKIAARTGRRPKSDFERMKDAIETDLAQQHFAMVKLNAKREGRTLTHVDAIAELAQAWGKSEEQMKHILYPSRASK